MRAILVDPVTPSVREIDTDGSLRSLQKLVGGYIEAVPLDDVAPELRGHHLYLNEEGRLHPNIARQLWSLRGWPEVYLCGHGVVLTSTRSGDEAPAKAPLSVVAERVRFLDAGEIFANRALGLSFLR